MTGKYLTTVAKQAAIQDALDRIPLGHRIADIAADHGISKPCLHNWLASLGDQYTNVRQMHTDAQIADARQSIDDIERPQKVEDMRETMANVAIANFDLARGREGLRYAMWYAEARDTRYQPKVASIIPVSSPITINMGTLTDEQLRAVATIQVIDSDAG